MQIEIRETKQADVKFLQASCGVRYWEDASVNGTEDTDGSLIPCRRDSRWEPLIDVETGAIQDWPPAVTADIHYKVCDDGEYSLLDAERNVVKRIEGYVPKAMCPADDGYGDYVIMTVGADGKIADWRRDFEAFSERD